jgi:hypothetical protein
MGVGTACPFLRKVVRQTNFSSASAAKPAI